MKKVIVAAFGVALFVVPSVSMAAGLTQEQVSSILNLLHAFGAPSSVIANVATILDPQIIAAAPPTPAPTTESTEQLQLQSEYASLEAQYSQEEQAAEQCINQMANTGLGAAYNQGVADADNALSLKCEAYTLEEDETDNEMRAMEGEAPIPVPTIQTPPTPETCSVPNLYDIVNGDTQITCEPE